MLFNPLLERAIELAAEWHDQMYRKGRWRVPVFSTPGEPGIRIPVMSHLTAVALLLQRAQWDDATVAAGFLHDILEDRNRFGASLTYDELAAAMGHEVADLVQGVSETKLDATGQWLPWRKRKEDYIEVLQNGTAEAMAISLADKVHNLWSMNQALESGIDIFSKAPDRKALSAGPEAQVWYFRAVLSASHAHNDTRLMPLREALSTEIERFIGHV